MPNRLQRSRIKKECTETLLKLLLKEQRVGWVQLKCVSFSDCVFVCGGYVLFALVGNKCPHNARIIQQI